MAENPNGFFQKLMTLDPAIWRSLIVAVIGLLGAFGIITIPGLPDLLLAVWIPLQAILQGLFIKPSVTANARVVVLAPDPVNNPQIVEAGEAVTTATPREIIAAAESSGTP